MAPSFTIHFEGARGASALVSASHFSSEAAVPSKRIMASEGGVPGWVAELNVPGSTRLGCGRLWSWMDHGWC